MQLVRQHIRGGALERSGIKAIYVAPMKALAQEVVSKFSHRLKALGLVRIAPLSPCCAKIAELFFPQNAQPVI